MPADSFESPLTLAACGGHVELAMLLLERGAHIEEVRKGYIWMIKKQGHKSCNHVRLQLGLDISLIS